MRLLNDNPAEEDRLGFDSIARILHEVMTNPPDLPLTVGIWGEWGSGKTTLMRLIQRRLQVANGKTVWFNAWKYDGKEVIWNALIQSIFFAIKADSTTSQRLRDRVASAARGLAIYAAKVATRFVPGGIIKEEDVEGVLRAVGMSANDELFAFINRFEAEFQQLVSDYVGEDGHLTVFIDDLDRCLPENAINVMEALKLYLDSAKCIFVVGAERAVIEEGIRLRYQDRLSATDYLEKIVQFPIVMPRVDADAGLSLLVDYEDLLPYRTDQELGTLIALGTETNPRRIKRFMNAFSLLAEIAGGVVLEQRPILAKVLLIQMRFPTLFSALVDDPGLAERMTEVLSLQGGETARAIAESPENVRVLYGDPELRRFLAETARVTMAADLIAPWIRQTRAATSVADLGTEHTPTTD